MDIELLVTTCVLLAFLVGLCLVPIGTDGREDEGDGRARVLIPRHVKTPLRRPRTWGFLGMTALLSVLFLQEPSLSNAYASGVRSLARAITGDPVSVEGYIARLHPATQFLALAYIVGISVVARATPARRLAMLSHMALYIVMSGLLQALMIAVGIATHWLVVPFGIEATLTNLIVGGLVIMRLTFTAFVLPRGTTVPIRRPRWIWDTVVAGCSLIGAAALLVIGYAFLADRQHLTSEWQVLLPLYAGSILLVLLVVPLWALWWGGTRPPKPGPDLPPVDVIVPAYNEAENIAQLLRSVDAAAGRYGGLVNVVLSDDGSTDDTAQIAHQEISRFAHARGQVLSAPNGGQASALNRGLSITDAEIVVRIDADCVLGPDALVFAVPWFRDPKVGCVGAMEEPRTDGTGWLHRLRLLETMFQFRFVRLAQSLVDGIVVIPGTFTAFRRSPAMLSGGFPVGMNGEDSDLTMQIGRLGYRVVVDPRIRSFEDVPRSVGEFVEQRTRWARAGFHVYARHVPLRSGLAGPRVWLWTIRRGFFWFSLQLGIVAPIFTLELVLTHPTYRQNIATFVALFVAGGAVPLAVGVLFAIRHGRWRSLLWLPAWFAYGFLRRLGTLEAVISLPTRPFPAPSPRLSRRPVSGGGELADPRAT